MWEKLLSKLLDIIDLGKSNESRHISVIVVGLSSAILIGVYLIGLEQISTFFNQFRTDIVASSGLAIALFVSNSILAILCIIAGFLELDLSNEKFKSYVPPPPQGTWLLNIFICVFMTLQLYLSIVNILLYCIVYIVYVFIDTYFRYSISNSVNISIQKALKDLALARSTRKNINIEDEILYKNLLEVFIHYKRYPKLCLFSVRILLSILSLGLIFLSKHTSNIEWNNIAYINMIYCIIINEVFSWGYRSKMLISLRSND
ncbi:MAG: hypothetical protein WCI11_10805 [Candidatus Methylumidiphilus sp.]